MNKEVQKVQKVQEVQKVTDNMDQSTYPLSAKQPKGRVLVVDDEEYAREVLGDILDSLGFEVISAKDGFEGLDSFEAESNGISACVIDLTMPGMAGLELLEKIRNIDQTVPVILVSGYTRHEVRQKEANSANVGFLQKPFTKGQFQDALEARLATND
ncbi:MAG: response regulator [Gammaproteobacteria bacterium]|nr:response regulator [Gammaproteobacteria bacterium]